MPFSITLDNALAGFSLNAARKGEYLKVSLQDFVSSEDGDKLIACLDGISSMILARLPNTILPSMIDHFLVILSSDKNATVYVNELEFEALVRTRRPIRAGEPILSNDILDIDRLRIRGVTVPSNAGVMVMLSAGWRKGFYYDLVPLHDAGPHERAYDIERLLGQVYSYLQFQALFKITESTWQEMFRQRYFPFVFLGYDHLEKMIGHASQGWDMDDLLDEIKKALDVVLEPALSMCRNNAIFTPHMRMFETAVERYKAEDHISASTILYPRIEGVMRTYFKSAGIGAKPSSSNLATGVIEKGAADRHSHSLFLPDKFREYLENVYFAHFEPGSSPEVGRHSVAHGEARVDDFSLKSTVIGFLTLFQVALFLSPDASVGTNKT